MSGAVVGPSGAIGGAPTDIGNVGSGMGLSGLLNGGGVAAPKPVGSIEGGAWNWGTAPMAGESALTWLGTSPATPAKAEASVVFSMVLLRSGLLARVLFSHVELSSPESRRLIVSNLFPGRVELFVVMFSKPVCSMVRLRKVEFNRLEAGRLLFSRTLPKVSCPRLMRPGCDMVGLRRGVGGKPVGAIAACADGTGAIALVS